MSQKRLADVLKTVRLNTRPRRKSSLADQPKVLKFPLTYLVGDAVTRRQQASDFRTLVYEKMEMPLGVLITPGHKPIENCFVLCRFFETNQAGEEFYLQLDERVEEFCQILNIPHITTVEQFHQIQLEE